MINIKSILSIFSNISKPQKKFLAKFLSISSFSGKANIKNICRYGKIAPRMAYRQIQKPFALIKYIAEKSHHQERKRGTPRKYDVKFDVNDLSRFEKIIKA